MTNKPQEPTPHIRPLRRRALRAPLRAPSMELPIRTSTEPNIITSLAQALAEEYSTPADEARKSIAAASSVWEIAELIGQFGVDPPDSEYQLIYLRTLTNEFQHQIATLKLSEEQ